MTDRYFLRRLDEGMHDTSHFMRDMHRLGSDALWTSEDTKRAIMFSVIPGAVSFCAFAASFSKDRNVIEWWNASKKPDWAPTNPKLYGMVDVATIAPLGYASYLVYKHGGGLEYNDTKLALALYGGSMVCAFLTIPLVRRKNYLCLFRNSLVMHLTGLAAAFTYYKIDNTAGLLMVPYTLWTGFYTVLTYWMSKMNTSDASQRSAL